MRTGQEFLSEKRRRTKTTQIMGKESVFAGRILMSSSCCVYIKDIEKGTILFATPEFARVTGYSPEAIQEMNREAFSSLVHPEDRARVDRHMLHLQYARHNEGFEVEYRFQTSDGRWIWCQCFETIFERNEDGSALQAIGSFQDISRWKSGEASLRQLVAEKDEALGLLNMEISDRKEAENALKKAHEQMEEQIRKRTSQLESTIKKLKKQVGERKSAQSRFRQLSRVFMDAADPIVIEDLNGNIMDINREAENVYGWKRRELIGRSMKTLIPAGEQEKSEQFRRRSQNGDEVRHWEGLRQNRNHETFDVLVTAFCLTNGRGRPVALATIARDISNLKQMETKLKHSRKRLQDISRKSLEALESDRQSVAKEIHDSIGASLAAIKFGLEGMLSGLEKDPDGTRAKLETTISQLVDTIKETKQISANLRPTTLDDLGLLATIDWYFRRFNERYPAIELTRQFDIGEHEIPEARKIVIYRILQEALNNAAKHSRAEQVTIRLNRKDSRIRLEIEDNGKGFDVDEVLHREDPLSGHGLANMKERTDLCGGSFLLFSRPGAGTRIIVTLPSDDEAVY